MSEHVPSVIDADAPIFVISVAAGLAGMHPQTLRQYDRLGLVVPQRTRGRGRRYSRRDLAKLRLVQHLSQEEGINLPGIQRILDQQSELETLRTQLAEALELLAQARAASVQSRLFTADQDGGVRLGRHRGQRALPR